jgi:hypothetical protein
MNVEQAEAIVIEAKAQGVVVYDTGDAVADAEVLLKQAQDAYDGGVRGDHVTRILKMGGVLSPGSQGSSKTETIDTMAQPVPVQEKSSGELQSGHPDPTPYRSAAEGFVQAQGLPVPPAMAGEPSEMPRDFTTVGDREIRKLHGEYGAYLARVSFLLGIERADKEAAERLAEHNKNRALREAATSPHYDGTDKIKPQHVMLAEAAADPEVEKWSERVAQHEANLSLLYTLRDIYSGHVERLSKEWRMRVDEWQMSGGSR